MILHVTFFYYRVENKCHCCQSVLSDHMNKLQEKFDRKTKELINHVQIHQKLSKKYGIFYMNKQ